MFCPTCGSQMEVTQTYPQATARTVRRRKCKSPSCHLVITTEEVRCKDFVYDLLVAKRA